MRIECASSPDCRVHMNPLGNPMHIKCASIIVHNLRTVTPTMRSLVCLLAWLVMGCGMLYRSLLEKKGACFLMVEKSDTATIGIWGG